MARSHPQTAMNMCFATTIISRFSLARSRFQTPFSVLSLPYSSQWLCISCLPVVCWWIPTAPWYTGVFQHGNITKVDKSRNRSTLYCIQGNDIPTLNLLVFCFVEALGSPLGSSLAKRRGQHMGRWA